MNDRPPEPGVTDRIDERPSFDPGKIAQARPRDLAIRFVAGALTSVASGLVTLAFSARAGGILLAFPALLAASLTLIEQQEDSVDAREDARGAIAGGFALAVFAAVAAVSFGHIAGALALAVAALAWLLTSGLLYAVFWRG
ncbi:MAG TPA: DUF3147 family protein [Solirubrobacteraceae bacterium]|jgi:hypothetical protein|nr:DUF3147 family protein [Solirubrobacteraceae bacterium]